MAMPGIVATLDNMYIKLIILGNIIYIIQIVALTFWACFSALMGARSIRVLRFLGNHKHFKICGNRNADYRERHRPCRILNEVS